MALRDAYFSKLERKKQAEEAAGRPHDEAYARLKALFHEIMGDRQLLDHILAEVELNGDELQIDPGPIFIRVAVDQAGDYHMTYEIKANDDPEIIDVPVKSIPDIEEAIANLLIQYARQRD
ncbi:hypothetical protein LJR219_001590 [Phenylobacterium sp. LjRoot219]|uniref:hypothetical protein n=1 Tax=Phenylobacterium sp. LjRoot219 TaxID=3342283 RepID=UPI003ECC6D51